MLHVFTPELGELRHVNFNWLSCDATQDINFFQFLLNQVGIARGAEIAEIVFI